MQRLTIRSFALVDPRAENGWADLIPAAMKRRDPRIWQLAWLAARRAIDTAAVQPASIVVATALGALDETARFLDGVFKDGFGSPRNFIASVHNSMAGKLAVDLKISGPNLTLCEGANSLASAIVAASLLNPGDSPVLLVAVDEEIELLRQISDHLGKDCRQWLGSGWADGAVALVLDHARADSLPSISASGPRLVGDVQPETVCAGLAQELSGNEPCELTPPACGTFLSPAQSLHALLTSAQPGCRAVGSYSPTSRGAAVVTLWQ
jgi:hypothetical protein